MKTHKILADETISVSELRKNPGQYFTDHAIAVLSSNRPIGYVIGSETYEALVALLVQNQETEHFTGRFRPTAARMKTIARKGAERLANASEEKLGEFPSNADIQKRLDHAWWVSQSSAVPRITWKRHNRGDRQTYLLHHP